MPPKSVRRAAKRLTRHPWRHPRLDRCTWQWKSSALRSRLSIASTAKDQVRRLTMLSQEQACSRSAEWRQNSQISSARQTTLQNSSTVWARSRALESSDLYLSSSGRAARTAPKSTIYQNGALWRPNYIHKAAIGLSIRMRKASKISAQKSNRLASSPITLSVWRRSCHLWRSLEVKSQGQTQTCTQATVSTLRPSTTIQERWANSSLLWSGSSLRRSVKDLMPTARVAALIMAANSRLVETKTRFSIAASLMIAKVLPLAKTKQASRLRSVQWPMAQTKTS